MIRVRPKPFSSSRAQRSNSAASRCRMFVGLVLIFAAVVLNLQQLLLLPEVTALTTMHVGERLGGGDTTTRLQMSSSGSNNNSNNLPPDDSKKPILVVGATGRVGRKVVQQLMAAHIPVRALVRNPIKAQQLFGTSDSLQYPPLEIVVADVASFEDCQVQLDQAVAGCRAIISVMGSTRVCQWSDFLPWRLFQSHNADWAGRDHPYYGNYLGQVQLLKLAEKHGITRFVRLHGLAMAYSAFNPIVILFNTLLSFSNRWTILFEQALAASRVPYLVLRPGGLASEERNTETTNLQVDASGKLPLPCRVGRTDIAALCVAAVTDLPPTAPSYTLACRWCGPDVKPRPQGRKSDGFATARDCLRNLLQNKDAKAITPPKMKPYGVAVGVTVYTLAAVGAKVLYSLWKITRKLFLLAE